MVLDVIFMKKSVYVLGTIHGSEKSVKGIESITTKMKFDTFFSEGVDLDKTFNKSNFIKEPILIPFLKLYFHFLSLRKSELRTLKDIANKTGVRFINVDRRLSDVISDFHKSYNYLIIPLIYIVAFATITVAFNSMVSQLISILYIFVSIAAMVAIYFIYFLVGTKGNRERYWIKNIITNSDFRKALLICGKEHVNSISASLLQEGFSVEKI